MLLKTIVITCFIIAAEGFAIVESDNTHHKIPSFIKICRRSDPNLENCVKSTIQDVRPYLKHGIPELDIPSLEPLIIPEVVLNQGKGSINFESTYHNVHVHGPSDFTLQQIKVDLDKNRVKVKLRIPRLQMSGNYTIRGKILMLPIVGNGTINGNYSDITATALAQGERYTRDGKTYINIKDFFLDFNIGHAVIHLSNLFQGDKQLGDSMNEFLNDNWKTVAQDMKPVLEKKIGEMFKDFANRIHHKYSLDELLPP